MPPTYWLVMPAAGKGERMGMAGTRVPKQYQTLAGRAVIEHALAPFRADPACIGLVVALAPGDTAFARLPLAADPRIATVTGGASRADSVRAGLLAVAARVGVADTWVLVHDAARPCLSPADLARLLAALGDAPDGALLGIPIADTLKRADEAGRVSATVPRQGLWRAATPQAFLLKRLLGALGAHPAATDEAGAVEATGGRPLLVAGSPGNLKLTTPADLGLAACILAGERP